MLSAVDSNSMIRIALIQMMNLTFYACAKNKIYYKYKIYTNNKKNTSTMFPHINLQISTKAKKQEGIQNL